MTKETKHKATIETIINTAAIALTATGTAMLVNQTSNQGYLLIIFGIALEFIKYVGRSRNLW